ncbi:MAG TPA: serine/threonine-protein kinase [Candidatus Dormibacteraeota bacterium]|nr:serine/threonine-protein kinase [Candidatus Dormibacteraeota bacterium]
MVDIQELEGSSIGGYQLLTCLGHGTHTAVYRATGSLGSQWALKVIDRQLEPESTLVDRLRREASLCSRVDHPAILPMYDVGRDEQVTFATAPFLEAPTLEQLMHEGRVDADLLWSVVSQIADALERAHDLGLVCRVLKPNNILVDSSGHAYLAEFGIASRRTGPMALTSPGYNLRAPQYLAPEQVEGKEPSRRADVYAMGVLIFEILTETPLFGGRSVGEVLTATLNGQVPSAHARNRRLPPGIDRVLGRALAKDPAERHQSVWELLDELVNVPDIDHQLVVPTTAGAISPPPGPPPPVETLPQAQEEPPAAAEPVASPPSEVAEPAAEPAAEAAPVTVTAPPAPIAADSAVSMLHKMGVPNLEFHDLPILNSYFACVMRHAKEVSERRWPQVLEAAGLQVYASQDPPDDGERTATVEECSRLAEGFEVVFGPDAPAQLRALGRRVTDDWLRSTQPKPFRMMGRPESKVADALYVFNHSMDRVRGEPLHAWKQIDKRQFWVVHYGNLFAVGRIKPAKSCHFWVAAFESALRWGGLANDWAVEETECGCVTGSFACVFTVERVGT